MVTNGIFYCYNDVIYHVCIVIKTFQTCYNQRRGDEISMQVTSWRVRPPSMKGTRSWKLSLRVTMFRLNLKGGMFSLWHTSLETPTYRVPLPLMQVTRLWEEAWLSSKQGLRIVSQLEVGFGR